jgi:hypothetical protein
VESIRQLVGALQKLGRCERQINCATTIEPFHFAFTACHVPAARAINNTMWGLSKVELAHNINKHPISTSQLCHLYDVGHRRLSQSCGQKRFPPVPLPRSFDYQLKEALSRDVSAGLNIPILKSKQNDALVSRLVLISRTYDASRTLDATFSIFNGLHILTGSMLEIMQRIPVGARRYSRSASTTEYTANSFERTSSS